MALAVFCLYRLIATRLIPADTPSSTVSYDKIRQIERAIDEHYLGEVDKQELTDYMFLGLVAGLGDRYSTYYTRDEYEDVTTTQSGYFEGIGIEVVTDEDSGRVMVKNVIGDAPADRAGMEAGDLLLTVGGVDVTGFTPSEVVELIQSDVTGKIVIVALRDGEELEFSMVPEKVYKDPVVYEILEDNIGYIKISTFNKMTQEQFGECLEAVKEADVKGLIIDLRGNLGGLVSAACDTLCEFMPEGLLVYTEDKYGERTEHSCDGKNALDLPMVLLVDGYTASSAEIFSGAVKDYGVATLIGEQTFGKGIVQNPYTLSDGSVVRLTTAHYYTPLGHDIHGEGIAPDLVVEGEEEQLQKAVELLNE